MGELGIGELVVVLLVVLVLFGPGRLPKAAEGLGKAVRSFKDALSGRADAPERVQPSSAGALPRADAEPAGTGAPGGDPGRERAR